MPPRRVGGQPLHPIYALRADGAHHDVARVQADPDLDRYTRGTPPGRDVAADRLLHSERRVTSPDRMVLVGERRSEESHDPVAHHLAHRALKTVHGLHHELQDRIEYQAGLLGIAASEELHGIFEIGEEHCDLFVLALECGPAREDALRKMPGRVRVGRNRLRYRRAQRRPALVAESMIGRVGGVTGGTQELESSAASAAELRAGEVVVFTSGTAHALTSALRTFQCDVVERVAPRSGSVNST